MLFSLRENLVKLGEIVLKPAFPAPFHLIYYFNKFMLGQKIAKTTECQVNTKKYMHLIYSPI